jgi:hypothetical protein
MLAGAYWVSVTVSVFGSGVSMMVWIIVTVIVGDSFPPPLPLDPAPPSTGTIEYDALGIMTGLGCRSLNLRPNGKA